MSAPQLCRQVSIESPHTNRISESVFLDNVPMPDVPNDGALVKVYYAGARHKRQSTTLPQFSKRIADDIRDIRDDTRDLPNTRDRNQNYPRRTLPPLCELPERSHEVHHQRPPPSHRSPRLSSHSSRQYSQHRPHRLRRHNLMLKRESIGEDISNALTTSGAVLSNPTYIGMLDTSLFPGYEVSGRIEAMGAEADTNTDFKVGDRVLVYPFDNAPVGYSEYLCVPDLRYLVRVPDSVPLSVAAMLPTGALWAMNTVQIIHEYAVQKIENGAEKVKIMIVGTGGLAMWAIQIAEHFFQNIRDKILLTVACLRDEGILWLKKNCTSINIVQWNEDAYEDVLIERTRDACNGSVDLIVNFGTSLRTVQRSLNCLDTGGKVFIGSDVADKFLPKFSSVAEAEGKEIVSIENGSLEQLQEMVMLVEEGKIHPPPHQVFHASEASDVVRQLTLSQIQGRAILKFSDIEE